MTEKNLEKFKEIAYDYHRLDSMDEVYEHFVEINDDTDIAHMKLSDVYKQKYEFFKNILKDEGYSDDDIRKLEYVEGDFKYYYALCLEPKCFSDVFRLIPFLSEEHRQQFINKEKSYYREIIPIDLEKIILDNNKQI